MHRRVSDVAAARIGVVSQSKTFAAKDSSLRRRRQSTASRRVADVAAARIGVVSQSDTFAAKDSSLHSRRQHAASRRVADVAASTAARDGISSSMSLLPPKGEESASGSTSESLGSPPR